MRRGCLAASNHRLYSCRMRILENIISDRGSKYAVSGGPCATEDAAKAFLKELCRNKKFAKATHSSWALLTDTAPLKNDDGEAGAGMVILRMLDREGLRDHIIVVTRWFGGKPLGGDRFRHVQEAVRIYLEDLRSD
jgi:putative IMPACT (imprinted ancient) family translation regulator